MQEGPDRPEGGNAGIRARPRTRKTSAGHQLISTETTGNGKALVGRMLARPRPCSTKVTLRFARVATSRAVCLATERLPRVEVDLALNYKQAQSTGLSQEARPETKVLSILGNEFRPEALCRQEL